MPLLTSLRNWVLEFLIRGNEIEVFVIKTTAKRNVSEVRECGRERTPHVLRPPPIQVMGRTQTVALDRTLP
jgi:hypothetical protein